MSWVGLTSNISFIAYFKAEKQIYACKYKNFIGTNTITIIDNGPTYTETEVL